MATAILSSQNSLNGFDHETLIHRNPNSSLRRHSYAATTAPRRRKRIPTPSQSTTVVVSPAANTNLVMGQVKILKRGESLSAFLDKKTNNCGDRDHKKRPVLKMNGFDLVVATTNRLGPEPEIVQKQIGVFKELEIITRNYAGAGCSVSPPPCSVPVPCFLRKNNLLR